MHRLGSSFRAFHAGDGFVAGRQILRIDLPLRRGNSIVLGGRGFVGLVWRGRKVEEYLGKKSI